MEQLCVCTKLFVSTIDEVLNYYSRRTVILTHAYFDITVILTQQQRTLPSLIAGFPASPEEGEEAAQPHKPP